MMRHGGNKIREVCMTPGSVVNCTVMGMDLTCMMPRENLLQDCKMENGFLTCKKDVIRFEMLERCAKGVV